MPSWADNPVVSAYLDRVQASLDLREVLVTILADNQHGTENLARLFNAETDHDRLRELVHELYGRNNAITERIWEQIVPEATILRIQEAYDLQGNAIDDRDLDMATTATETLKQLSPEGMRPSWDAVLSMLTPVKGLHENDIDSIHAFTDGLYERATDLLRNSYVAAVMEEPLKEFPAHDLPTRKVNFDFLWQQNGTGHILYTYLLNLGVPKALCTAISVGTMHDVDFGPVLFGYLHAVLPPEKTLELQLVLQAFAPDNPAFFDRVVDKSMDLHSDRASEAFFSYMHQGNGVRAREELVTLHRLAEGHDPLVEAWQKILDMFDSVGIEAIKADMSPEAKRFDDLLDHVLTYQQSHPSIAGELDLGE